MSDSPEHPAAHAAEPHVGGLGQKLTWLRAGMLGANDGIVSTAGLVVGVAAATPRTGPILTAGVAGLVAGAVSMALGEYVSVSAQRDTERALLVKERRELGEMPQAELEELTAIYAAKGASPAWKSPATHFASTRLGQRSSARLRLRCATASST